MGEDSYEMRTGKTSKQRMMMDRWEREGDGRRQEEANRQKVILMDEINK